jgi:hypothetical protein
MTVDESSTPADVVTGAEAKAAVAGFSAPEPAVQPHEPDFLVGDLRREHVNPTSEPPTPGTDSRNVRAVGTQVDLIHCSRHARAADTVL